MTIATKVASEFYLGVDIGSSWIKAAAVDPEGRLIASSRVRCETLSPRAGFFEVDAEASWMGGFLRALAALKPQEVGRARALCVSSVCASFVPVDKAFQPLRNAILYGIDTRAAAQVERLNRRFTAERLEELLGSFFTSHSVLPKLLWLKEKEPDVYREAVYFLESGNYVTSRLTGVPAWDIPTASGAQLLDLAALDYPRCLLVEAGLDGEKLPPLRYPTEMLGKVTREGSELSGLRPGTPVLTGACDVNAEALAAGAAAPGDLLLVYGSTLSVLGTSSSRLRAPGFISGASLMPGTFRLGGATSSGSRFLSWVKDLLAPAAADLRPAAEGPTGIIMLPFLDGARLPFHNPRAATVWFGMDSRTDSAVLLRAAGESLGYEISVILERMEVEGRFQDPIHATGGLSADTGLLATVSHIIGRPQKVHDQIDAAYGDALLAMTAEADLDQVLKLPGVRAVQDRGVLLQPDPAQTAAFAVLRERYRRLYQAMEPLFG